MVEKALANIFIIRFMCSAYLQVPIRSVFFDWACLHVL